MSPEVLGFFLIVFYFLPSVLGWSRGSNRLLGIFVLNLILGWTIICWIIALIWALSATPKKRIAQDRELLASELAKQMKQDGGVRTREFD